LRSPPPLTYRHRAGVRLYTSAYALAESCVFDKQSPEPIHCGSLARAPLVPKVRGHFAEFLHEGSPERLRMLAWPTCVGLRYGPTVCPAGFFVAEISTDFRTKCRRPCGTGASATPIRLLSASPAFNLTAGCWNIRQLPIDYAFRPRLRTRLTLGGLPFPRKPWAFGGRASHPSCRYSFRHAHSNALHGSLPVPLQRTFDALLLLRQSLNPRLRRDT
jgi:hypothetical protein